MSEIDDGGPAFPTEAARVHPADIARLRDYSGWSASQARSVLSRHSGMTLRDWFAGQALVGMTARGVEMEGLGALAYHIADAMLKARQS